MCREIVEVPLRLLLTPQECLEEVSLRHECALDGFVVCGLGSHDFLASLFVQPLCLILPCARLIDRFHGCVSGIAFRPRCALLGLRLLRSPVIDDHSLLQVILHPVQGNRDPLVWDRLRCGWFRDRRLVPSLPGVVPVTLPRPPAEGAAAAQGFIWTWRPPLSSHPRKGTQLPPTPCQKVSRPHHQRPQPYFRSVPKVIQLSPLHTDIKRRDARRGETPERSLRRWT